MILSVLFATNWKVGLGASLGGAIATIAEMVTVTIAKTLPQDGEIN